MRKLIALLLVTMGIGAAFTLKPHNLPIQPETAVKPALIVPKAYTPPTNSELMVATNLWRTQNSLAPLTESPVLDASAKAKCQDMEAQNYWAHNRPNGEEPWVFFKQAGYHYSYAGENLAKSYDSATETAAAWENSPTHNANLLNPHYTQVGFATCEGPQVHLVVQHLARPL